MGISGGNGNQKPIPADSYYTIIVTFCISGSLRIQTRKNDFPLQRYTVRMKLNLTHNHASERGFRMRSGRRKSLCLLQSEASAPRRLHLGPYSEITY